MNQEILHIPSFSLFDNDWNLLQEYLNKKDNPPYSIGGNLDLYGSSVKSLGNLISVGGYLDLGYTNIESLGDLTSVGGSLDLRNTPIKTLGNLTSVGGSLDMGGSKVSSFGKLTSVGSFLSMIYTPISVKYFKDEIRNMIKVDGDIYL